jgi:hypothetical protein
MRMLKCARQRCQLALKTCAIAALRRSCASEMTSLPLQAVQRLEGSLSFSQARERRSVIEHPAMQRQGRKLLTNDGCGGPLPFRARRSTTACPPTCAFRSQSATAALRRFETVGLKRLKCANRGHSPAAEARGVTGDTAPAAGTSLELIGDLVQARLDAGLVDAWRA